MRVICFGDSITRGVSFVKGRLRILKDNYPALLQQMLQDGTNIIIQNKGVFNDNSSLLLQRLQKDVIDEEPDLVLICIGGNDCNFNWQQVSQFPDEEHEPIVDIKTYINNVKGMIQNIKDAGITPIMLTLPPLDPMKYYKSISHTYGKAISHWISKVGGIEHWHGQYNRRLNTLIKQMGVKAIDVRSALKKAGDLDSLISDDGIHLTSEGYYCMSKKIHSDLQKYAFLNV